MENSLAQNDEEITTAAFALWLKSARPKDRFEYHRGFLVTDREKVVSLPNHGMTAHVFYEPVHSLAMEVWRAHERGLVDLIQRKLGKERYAYFAVKRRRLGPVTTWRKT